MSWVKDIVGVDAVKYGTFRSLNGAADESIFQGRASKAGFFCFFKVWRDMPYDAVLDYNGILYRVEVKGSSNKKFDLTRGGRSGVQIKADTSKKRPINREDCDFVVSVDSDNGDCYIIPTDVVEIAGEISIQTQTAKAIKKTGNAPNSIGLSLSSNNISVFHEKWKLMMPEINFLTKEQTRGGLRNMSYSELTTLANNLQIAVPIKDYRIPRTQIIITKPEDKTVYFIWKGIAERI